MLLPKIIISYSEALLSASLKFSLTHLSHFTHTSHDALTRALKPKFPWKSILAHFLNRYPLNLGYLIVDETDVDKSFAKAIPGASWIFSHRKNKHIFGYHLVVVAWTNNIITIPITWRLWQKNSGKSKQDLALEMIKFCFFILRIRPHAWLFDSFYASESILKFLHKHSLNYFSQIPKNRLFDKVQLKKWHKNQPYWQGVGYIKGKLLVQIVKNRKKYFITNVIGIPRKVLLDTYSIRWNIEEIFRLVKSQLGFEKCQCRSIQVQMNHFGVCFVLGVILQAIAQKTGLSEYAIKERATFDHSFAFSLNLSTYLDGA